MVEVQPNTLASELPAEEGHDYYSSQSENQVNSQSNSDEDNHDSGVGDDDQFPQKHTIQTSNNCNIKTSAGSEKHIQDSIEETGEDSIEQIF